MNIKLTIPERLKDLRTERNLTLEQLSEATGISRAALGKYEADDFKDISPFSIAALAKFYGVSADYLMGLTERKNHPNTELDALHLGDDAIEVLKAGQFNHRLLSELICHKDFQRLMLDAEIYVDRIADMRINDMNTVLEAVRQMVLSKREDSANDLYLRTLELAQVPEEEYFSHVVADDLNEILRDIREAHKTDSTTADEPSAAAQVQQQLQTAMNFEGSSDEKKARALLATLGIDYDAITKEQFVNLIEVLRLSKHMKSPISQRGKSNMTHGKGKESVNKQENTPYPAKFAEYGVFLHCPILPDRCHNCNSFKSLSYEHPQNVAVFFLCAIPSGAASRIAYGSRSARGDRSLKTLRRSVFFTRPLMAHHAERLAEKQGVFLLCCLTRRQDPVRHRGREQLVPAV